MIKKPLSIDQALVEGRCVAFLGPGVSYQAYGSRRKHLLSVARSGAFDPEAVRSLEVRMDAGQISIDRAFDALMNLSSRETVVQAYADYFNRKENPKLPELLRLLGQLPFRHVISASVDPLISQAFAHRNPIELTGSPSEISRISDVFEPSTFSILWLCGKASQSETLRITSDEVGRFGRENSSFIKMLASVAADAKVLFVGVSLNQIDDLLSKLPELASAASYTNPVAYSVAVQSSDEFLSKRVEKQYDITLRFFEQTEQREELTEEIARLVRFW